MQISKGMKPFLTLSAILPLLVACTPLSIGVPTAEKPTLLIFPVEYVREAQISNSSGFEWRYEIAARDGSMKPLLVPIRTSAPDGMVVVDTLPPGDYRVRKVYIVPTGSGTRTYNNQGTPLNFPFRLRTGQITVFSRSLYVRTYNKIPGRGMSTTYQWDIKAVSPGQKKAMMDSLAALPNFAAWGIDSDLAGAPLNKSKPPPGKYQVAEEFKGDWSGRWRPVTTTETDLCIEGSLKLSLDTSKITAIGTDIDGTEYRLSASLVGDGQIRGKLSLDRTRVAKVTGKFYESGNILGTFEYADDCVAEWKAHKP